MSAKKGFTIELSAKGKVGGLFAVGVSESEEQLQRVMGLVHSYCWKCRL